jgi:bifunctional non-homologous end joining protein LigD
MAPIRSMKQGILEPSLSFVEPMKALTVQELPAGRWLYEVKFDGYRALAFKSGKESRLVSRNQKDFTKFPQLNDALKLLPAKQAVVDGEITALDSNGKSSFQLLQAYEIGEQRPPWSITPSICSSWKELICARNLSSNGAGSSRSS